MHRRLAMAGNPNDRPPGHFEKRYLDRNPGPWHHTTALQVRRQFHLWFIGIGWTLAQLYAGQEIRTAFADYRWVPATKRP